MGDTKTNILDVAEDLIQRVGLNAMSYKHISDAVGIRKASIHYHFPQKRDLVDALLSRCETSYGQNYIEIIHLSCAALEKLRQLADIFGNGVITEKLCLVGMISSDINTLETGSCKILDKTFQGTVDIFSLVFRQGREEGSLKVKGSDEDAAFAFFSLLVGAQIAARVHGGITAFNAAVETIITGWEV